MFSCLLVLLPSSLRKAAFSGKSENIHILPIETDDAWARDVGPTFVKNAGRKSGGISWQFNAWGGEVDGLYASWEKDVLRQRRSAMLLVILYMMQEILSWKAVPFTVTEKERC